MKTKPNPFATLANNLESHHFSPESVAADPNFHSRLDSYSILQQHALFHHLQSLLFAAPKSSTEPEPGTIGASSAPTPRGVPTPAFLASASLRILTLIERSKSRIDRAAARLHKKPAHHESFQLDAAAQFLIAELANGERPAKDLLKLAREVGLSERTINRAKADLCVLSFQRAVRPSHPDAHQVKTRCWFWTLPDSTYEFLNNTSSNLDDLRDFIHSASAPLQSPVPAPVPVPAQAPAPNPTSESIATSHCHIAMAT